MGNASDPPKDPQFKKVIQKFLKTPPKPRGKKDEGREPPKESRPKPDQKR